MPAANSITRRQWLRLGAGGVLAAGLWPGALRAAAAGGEFRFIAVNDLHYTDKRCGAWLERVVQQMKGHPERVDFCLVVGDLVEDGKPEQLGAVRELLAALKMPVYVVLGNHDYRTQTDRKAYEEANPGRVNYHFEHNGWQFVGLDTTDGLRYTKTPIAAATLGWLDDTLPKLDRKLPTVIFTHFPLGPGVTHRPTNADDLLGRFKDYNHRAVLGGHFHGFTEKKMGETVLTTNRCCAFSKGNHDGSKEKGYFLCHARDGNLTRTFAEVKPG